MNVFLGAAIQLTTGLVTQFLREEAWDILSEWAYVDKRFW